MIKFLVPIGLAWTLALSAFAILAMRLFYPHHRLIALSLYVISWIPFFISIWQKQAWLRQNNEFAQHFLAQYSWHFAIGTALLFFLYIFFILVPFGPSPIANVSDEELRSQIAQDTETLLYLDELLTVTNKEIQAQAEERQEEAFNTEKREVVRDLWQRFVEASFELDLMKQRYRTFSQINGFRRPIQHAESFLLAYTAFLSQYTHTLQLNTFVHGNSLLYALLNEEDNKRGIPKNFYHSLKQHLTYPDDLLRLNAGRGYLHIMRTRLHHHEEMLKRVDGKLEIIHVYLGSYPKLLVENPLEQLENLAFNAWFPLQRSVALQLSYIRTATRDYLITPKALAQYHDRFVPGDILLQRREWHATNIGIPGSGQNGIS